MLADLGWTMLTNRTASNNGFYWSQFLETIGVQECSLNVSPFGLVLAKGMREREQGREKEWERVRGKDREWEELNASPRGRQGGARGKLDTWVVGNVHR